MFKCGMMDNNGFITEVAAMCTIAICIMTFITFGITTGLWEDALWCSDMEIIDYEGYWGEDLVVIYTDSSDESVKQISNNYWATMAIRDDGSMPIETLQYCLNAKIPVSETFDITGYGCTVSIVDQDNGVAYCTTHTYVDSVRVEANQWVRIVTVPLDIRSISGNLNGGLYTVSFENAGNLEGISAPDGRSIDISIEDDIVRFLI